MLHILHIANDFGGTEVYRNLITHLDRLGVRQTVFAPLNPRVHNRLGNHLIDFITKDSKIIYSTSQKWYHRYLYSNKIRTVTNELKECVDLSTVSVIHTGTLCMTGAVAYEISKIMNIPFIVSIRNTDINTYFKSMWWKHHYFYSIMRNASKIIFISPQYKTNCFEIFFAKSVVAEIQSKVLICPNGIDTYYLDKKNTIPKRIGNPIKIIFAGGFKNGKNLYRLMLAIGLLRRNGQNVTLTAIGKGLPNRKTTEKYIDMIEQEAEGKPWISLMDYKLKKDLCEEYRNADIFVMPSLTETFGLSYVEALTQGLPIVYTRGQGFDGFYPDGEVGYAVDATDVTDIARGIEQVIQNYPAITERIVKLPLAEQFNWDNIAKRYLEIYEGILN